MKRDISVYYMDPSYLIRDLDLLDEAAFLRKCLVERHGERTVGPDPLRQTGRTTFILIEVLRVALKDRVAFLADTHTSAQAAEKLVWGWVEKLGLPGDVMDRIEFKSRKQNLDAFNGRIITDHE